MRGTLPISAAVQSPPDRPSSPQRADVIYPVLLALLIPALVFATVPFVEMGLNDDWAYARTAIDAARTGNLHYFGWSNSMIGFQAYWGALFVRFFGPSFNVLRLCTLPFSAGCALLLYHLARRSGLGPTLAAFATATVTCSPLFIPLAASFMTDLPSLFFSLATIACTAAALRARDRAASSWLVWLAGAAFLGWLGGTIRQFTWLAPLTALPYAAYARRQDRTFSLASAALAAACLLAAVASAVWFDRQPYALSETTPLDALEAMLHPAAIASNFVTLWLTLILLALPAAPLAWHAIAPRSRALRLAAFAVAALIFSVACRLEGRGAAAPWSEGQMAGLITPYGLFEPDVIVIGDRPRTIPPGVGYALAAAVILINSCALFRWFEPRATPPPTPAPPPSGVVPHLLLVFAASNLLVILDRSAGSRVFDRYLLPVLPGLLIPMLLHARRLAGPSTRSHLATAWAVLAVFALYGVATTHDTIAIARARLAAADRLRAAGIPRSEICAGVEYDGWTQIDLAGFINDTRIKNPPDAADPVPRASSIPFLDFWFSRFTPAVRPRYFVTLSNRTRGLLPSEFPPVPYTTWLPPFRREVLILTLNPKWGTL